MILRPGDLGAEVHELQHLLAGRGIAAPDTGEYDAATVAAVRVAQARFGLVVDGIAGPKTLLALRAGTRQPGHLSAADLQRAADTLGVPVAAVRAVNEVESLGAGFLTDGRPVILFERHIMYRQLRQADRDADALARQFPNIVSPQRGGYVGKAGEHMRLTQAIAIDRDCALASASWGLFQVMGYHWERLGYPNVNAFADVMTSGEGAQLDAFVRFVSADPALHKALAGGKWSTFAALYNGPSYKDNLYDVKLARAFARYQTEGRVAA
ncbi:N-acetylmuramidase domain-containing protein [Ralstonia pseudosolanacearum]|uniref:N-acetylmuramidase domain-containing protein n=1 Tax=Ralstonia pseudosolanacearum TaxID=1310165 RepID=UPI002676BE63|nr:N-acetylmuramidase domain-containing protein [Ralstonia pseudosolanacearum]MDO3522796.1 N-acetylmuramidase domain-containing protein [Ralstonia pseudosolanacearum]MDO3533480.1 N-acetylmuramidase domain-containing protein [Ralstonia pseudosolanacearum]MDO3549340.1 N-acetylmuramidase domain-containing protein [Ralstonia pseudosolanacearum]MDO3552804.1 N-acetylmuramidase domain-containing protein [Ralstonia pseudosolanacearum]MDO3569189.1 N-acetylmuramidase domain-containing protein [Ralstonia